MKIAVLGWGSLIWCLGTLRVSSEWLPDGPQLPIEFSRISTDCRLTLVLRPTVTDVQVLWALMAEEELRNAIENLKEREKTSTYRIGFMNLRSGESRSNIIPNTVDEIRRWADGRNMDAAIWTDLPPNFEEKTGTKFTKDNVIRYLKNLPDDEKERAEKYIRKAPEQIRTEFRADIEKKLGWTPIQT